MKERFLERLVPLLTEQEREILKDLLSVPILSDKEDFVNQANPSPQYLGPGKWLRVIWIQDQEKNSKSSIRLHQECQEGIFE